MSISKLKAITYTSGNIAAVGFGGINGIEVPTLLRAVLIFLSSIAIANLGIWWIFKLRQMLDEGRI